MLSAPQSLLAFLESLQYPFLIPLGGALIGGEEMIILVTILSVGTGVPTLAAVFVWSYIGTYTKDLVMFLIGKHGLPHVERLAKMEERFDDVAAFIDRLTHGNYFLALLITKFLYGARIVTIFYVAREKLSFLRFSIYNLFVTGLWMCVVVCIGWLAGRGIVNVTRYFGDITYGLGVLVIAAVAFYLVRIWLNKRISEEEHDHA